ncbi:hypothetical protein [Enterococcus sp. LJL51]|uniref:hypothetical protein n=1 Tax=Enterococcus sp. LJL51 TaxID=3416656 RepID=UPI003CF4E0AC
MEIDVWDLVKGDGFFIGSYPDNFAIGRYFSADELTSSSYEKIHAEYLEKYNPDGYEELELGVFDVDNYSGLWSGEYGVLEIIDKLKHIKETVYFDIELDVYDFDESFYNERFTSPYEAARATFFGRVHWSDEYIRFNGYGNLESLTERALEERKSDEIKSLGIF